MHASTSVVSAPPLHSGNGNGPVKCMSSIFVFKRAHLKFTVCGRKQASKQARVQCSPASVGLAQARPN